MLNHLYALSIKVTNWIDLFYFFIFAQIVNAVVQIVIVSSHGAVSKCHAIMWLWVAYCLFLKDGVMVLSATHRYKKKYVTTLLYKPI